MSLPTVPAQEQIDRGAWWRVVAGALVPLAVLVSGVLLTLLLTAIFRQALPSADFFLQQRVALLVILCGLCLTLILFGVALWRILRRLAAYPSAKQQSLAFCVLGASAVVIALPLVLAVFLPQHPAP